MEPLLGAWLLCSCRSEDFEQESCGRVYKWRKGWHVEERGAERRNFVEAQGSEWSVY